MQTCPRPLQSTSLPVGCDANQETLPFDLSPAAKAWRDMSEPQPQHGESSPGSAAPKLHRSGPPQKGKAEAEGKTPEPVEPAGDPPKELAVADIAKSDSPQVEAGIERQEVPPKSLFHADVMVTREIQMKERDRMNEEKKADPEAKAKAKAKGKAKAK